MTSPPLLNNRRGPEQPERVAFSRKAMNEETTGAYKARIAARFEEARKHARLSPADAAALIGKDAATIRRWETGQTTPAADLVRRAAEVYGCSADWLVGLSHNRYGLPTGKWIVDAGLLRGLRLLEPGEPSPLTEDVAAAAIKVPEGAEVVGFSEAQAFQGEVEAELKRLHRGVKDHGDTLG